MPAQSISYTIVDVFTSTRFSGNPLAIVHLPESTTLTQSQKLQITAEFNLSETVFLHPRSQQHPSTVWTIDIFTPGSELPFAGHPTIGSAWFLGDGFPDVDALTLRTKAGDIPVVFERGDRELKANAEIPHDVCVHGAQLRAEHLSSMQPHLDLSNLKYAPWPVVSIVNGMTFALIRLDTIELLKEVAPCSQHTPKDFVSLDQGWQPTFVGAYFYFMHEDLQTVSCRMIAGLLEDPATGSGACAFASYIALERSTSGQHQEHKFEIHQGDDMGRPSVIKISVATEGKKVVTVALSGSAVRVMEGTMYP